MNYEDLNNRWKHKFGRQWPASFDIGLGWAEIVDEALTRIENVEPQFEIHQVKSKFGGLRIYTDCDTDPRVRKVIADAESLAAHTCELCGSTNGVKQVTHNMWITTLCENHDA